VIASMAIATAAAIRRVQRENSMGFLLYHKVPKL
jgi:hypothetical protein